MGYLFADIGPEQGFYYTLIPISALLVALLALKKLTKNESNS